MSPLAIVIMIIFLAGLLGGITNFFLVYTTEVSTAKTSIVLLKSIFMGLCASFTVPLLLKLVRPDILNLETMTPSGYLLLAGVCILAAYFSKRYLEDLYSKMIKVEKTANEAKAKAIDVERKTEEIDNIKEVLEQISKDVIGKFDPAQKNEEIKAVAAAVLNSPYSYRTVHGIAEDIEKSDEKVITILELLKKAGYVESKKNKNGNDIWTTNYYQ